MKPQKILGKKSQIKVLVKLVFFLRVYCPYAKFTFYSPYKVKMCDLFSTHKNNLTWTKLNFYRITTAIAVNNLLIKKYNYVLIHNYV